MSTQETDTRSLEVTFSTEQGELPDTDTLAKLLGEAIYDNEAIQTSLPSVGRLSVLAVTPASKGDRPVTINEITALSTIVRMAQGTKRIIWIDEDDSFKTREGTARHICDENGNFLNEQDDVRDFYFRITTSMGFELFMPISEAIDKVQKGYLAEADPS